MKNISLLLLITISITLTSFKSSVTSNVKGSEYDVAQIYEGTMADSGVKALTSRGDLEEVELILTPSKIKEGTYKVEITRKGSDLYKLEGTNYYIETRYCYEYATYDNAILEIESNYGYTKGTIYFN